MNNETLYSLALPLLKGIGTTGAHQLFERYGSATEIFRQAPNEAGRIAAAFADTSDALRRANEELEFCEKKNIQVLPFTSDDYPLRLRQCEDAPAALFYKGNTPLNVRRVVSIVGTRHISEYGKDLCKKFCKELAEIVPDVLIVSGLAYGVDIHAHREALKAGLPTIGVLAHGLDRIYPSSHRDTAKEMVTHGGLLTEYMTQTNPDKGNFVRRNRIVAGMADATIVVESAAKGGALITAQLSQDYNRDVFAFPGRTTDSYSEGCNQLIRRNGAALITSASDFAEAMGWSVPEAPKIIQRKLFSELTAEQEAICKTLQGNEGKQINQIVVESNLPIQKVSALLFDLEMDGLVKALAGGRYRLLL